MTTTPAPAPELDNVEDQAEQKRAEIRERIIRRSAVGKLARRIARLRDARAGKRRRSAKGLSDALETVRKAAAK